MGKQISPKPSQILLKSLPRWTPNPSRSPLGAHFAPMPERSLILNGPKTIKWRPKAPKGSPRQPQNPPKCIPRPSQKLFLLGFRMPFFQPQVCSDFSIIFSLFVTARTLENYGFPTVKPHFSQNRRFPR